MSFPSSEGIDRYGTDQETKRILQYPTDQAGDHSEQRFFSLADTIGST